MREQLTQYVNLLFAGVKDSDDMRMEILQNTLDKYDDLVSQGKSPEAAYRLAISGIGDINEILGTTPNSLPYQPSRPAMESEDPKRKKLRGLAIALYILCALPVIVLSEYGHDILGLSITLVIVAIATYLIMITGRKEPEVEPKSKKEEPDTPQKMLRKTIHSLLDAIMLAVYLLISFKTKAWAVTWLIFPIFACISGLVDAIWDLKEAKNHEN